MKTLFVRIFPLIGASIAMSIAYMDGSVMGALGTTIITMTAAILAIFVGSLIERHFEEMAVVCFAVGIPALTMSLGMASGTLVVAIALWLKFPVESNLVLITWAAGGILAILITDKIFPQWKD